MAGAIAGFIGCGVMFWWVSKDLYFSWKPPENNRFFEKKDFSMQIFFMIAFFVITVCAVVKFLTIVA